ncbi:hypothetical protein ACHAXT_000378 [Thalassiosira profunda]
MCQPPIAKTAAAAAADGAAKDTRASNEQCALSHARRTLEHGTLLACLSLLLLIAGLAVTFPQMQSRRDELGCDALCYGSMTSVRSALGLVGTAVVGRLSDKNSSILARTLGSLGKGTVSSGRRACLHVGTIASLVGLVTAATVNSLRGLWMSMVPGALLQHNFDIYKSLLSEYHNDIEHLETQQSTNGEIDGEKADNTNNSQLSRSGSVGKLGMAAGLSFMIGPMIAAVASPTFQMAAYFAIVCTLASGVIVCKLPMPVASAHTATNENNTEKEQSQTQTTEFTLTNMLRLKTPRSRAAATLIVIRLNMALAFHVFNTIWPASLKARFNFGPSDHARFMSFIGITYAFSQGFLAKRLVQMWGKEGKVYIIMTSCAVLGAGRYVAYHTDSLVVIYAVFLFIINALGTLNTVLTADTGAIAPSNEIGGLFGILQAAESAAGMIGPVLGGAISRYLGKDAPLLGVVGVYCFLFVFVSWGYERYVTSCTSDNAKGAKKSV